MIGGGSRSGVGRSGRAGSRSGNGGVLRGVTDGTRGSVGAGFAVVVPGRYGEPGAWWGRAGV